MDLQLPITPLYQLQNRVIVLFNNNNHHWFTSRQHHHSHILYILYVRDIPQPDNDFTKIAQYADDIAIETSHIHPYRAEDYLQHDINRIHEWHKEWRIELNPKKSQILYIAKQNRMRGRQPYLTLNNTIIPVANQVRFLAGNTHRQTAQTWVPTSSQPKKMSNNVSDYFSELPELKSTC
ncbi:hypothetical protein BSL78_16887 [Apostichopus japonicus]|uniref:Reverse transcriptase domain-containing protein n=1 Tax=Stichopus japonicus TaxID=307972 RepID=A0A2G8KE65_STIJA|nr:hypothetical protein BSL78_16887 [Apostichopus japonicus]